MTTKPRVITYAEEFPAGCRVIVRAGEHEGTDREFNGRRGTVLTPANSWPLIHFDKPPPYWKNPVHICAHNLMKVRT